jgi:hypothetical protein
MHSECTEDSKWVTADAIDGYRTVAAMLRVNHIVWFEHGGTHCVVCGSCTGVQRWKVHRVDPQGIGFVTLSAATKHQPKSLTLEL